MRACILILVLLSACTAPPPEKFVPVFPEQQALAWEKNHPEKRPWSVRVYGLVEKYLPAFSAGTDWRTYCPSFEKITDDDRVFVISSLVVEISRHESAFNAMAINQNDVAGTDSLGLFQLSYEDKMKWCSMNESKGNLLDPIVNIECAVPKMAQLIDEDKVVAVGEKYGTRKGLARYWAVMWPKIALAEIRNKILSLPICN